MHSQVHSLMSVFKGWDGYQTSLVQAIAPRSREQLIWRPTPHLRSAGEIARHISAGRVDWFYRTFGEESIAAARQVASWEEDETIQEKSAELVTGLEASWRMIEDALSRWTVADLDQTFPLSFQGKRTMRFPASGFSGA